MNSGDQAVLLQVLGPDLGEQVALVDRVEQRGAEADDALAGAGRDDVVQAGERAGHDEQHVRRVDLDELLVGVLAATLGRHRGGSCPR